MDTEKFSRSNHKLKRREVLKREILGMTIKFYLFRMDNASLPDTNSIVITPSYSYVPRDMFLKVKKILVSKEETSKIKDSEVIDYMMTEFSSEYTYTSSMLSDFFTNNIFDCLKWRTKRESTLNQMMIYTTETSWYFNFFGVKNKGKVIFRFWPNSEEKNVFRKLFYENSIVETPILTVTRFIDMLELMNKTQMAFLKIDRICDLYFNKKKKWKKNDDLFKLGEDMMTTITNTVAGKLNMNKVDYFNRARHEVFMKTVIATMGEDPPDQSDVDLTQALGYTGPKYFQTPDYIYNLEDRLIILDFAVTGSDPGAVRDRKIKKYTDLALNLETFLGKPVEVEAVVWKINSINNFYIPPVVAISSMALWEQDTIQSLKKLYNSMESKEGFNFYKKSILEEKEDQDFEETASLLAKELRDLIEYKLDCMELDIKATPIENSRKEMEFWDRITQKKVLPKDMKFYKESMEKINSLDPNYLQKVSDLYINMVKTNRVPSYQDSFTIMDLEQCNKTISEEIKKSELTRQLFLEGGKKDVRKVPKMLPFPLISLDNDKPLNKHIMGMGTYVLDYEQILEDGTALFKSDLDYSKTHEKEKYKKESQEYASDGIGIDMAEDISKIEDLIEWMMESSFWVDKYNEFGGFPKADKFFNLYNTNMWKLVDFYSNLAENICYLEGRRFYREDKKDLKSKGYSVAKNFGDYILIIKRGSRLTKEKQLRFKIITDTTNVLSSNFADFKSMEYIDETKTMMQSTWLTISAPMIKHFVKMKETVVLLYSTYRDKVEESNRGKVIQEFKMDKTFATLVLVMLEAKRGTSTTLQLNRYLLHSSTSYITNRSSLIKDIMSDPIRTRVEAYFRIMQFKWYEKMLNDSESMWSERLTTMLSDNNDYDRFMTWSPYDLEKKVEFSILMDCIYACNLFEKGTGFVEHRVKAIMSKMVAAERHFLKVKDLEASKGNMGNLIDFWNTKDELHMFDSKWYMTATKRFFDKQANKLEVMLAIEDAMSETVNTAMMMTSSLTGGPIPSKNLKFSKDVEKTKTFLSIFEEIEGLNTNNLLELVSKYDEVEAIFALFPKAQIGGPREILIMSVKLRLMVKFLEVVAEKMCKLHPKEMLSKDKIKSQLQSDFTNSLREEQKELVNKNINSIAFSFNMDASKWAPGFVMEQFFVTTMCMDLPEKIKNILLSVVSAFSSKYMFTPDSLKKKWQSKPTDEKESREDLEWFRMKAMSQGTVVEIISGMGQGMLHKFSSFMACMVDDASDLVVSDVVLKMHGVKMKTNTVLSSDDKTKFLLFYGNIDSNKLNQAVISYSKCWDSLTRLSNIHINWKKSGMNFIISEFNSLFSIGRRMVWATIKDVYNAFNTPDLTWPEASVQELMSSLRRCLEHGIFMTSIETAAKLSRNMLRRFYKLDNKTVEEIKSRLNSTDERLPFHLGFFPTTNLASKLIMGKEVSMFSSENSKELMTFYKKAYSAQKNKVDEKMKSYIPFSEDSRGRFWMMINMNMDKSLKDMKREFFENKLDMTTDEIMKEMDKTAMNINLPQNDWKSHKKFTMEYFVGMNRNYEFNDTMAVHSLVRALQYSSKKAVVMPKTKARLMMEDQLNNLEDKIKFKAYSFEENLEMLIEAKDTLQRELDKDRVGVVEFMDHVLLVGSEENSTFNLMSSLETLEDQESDFKKQMETYPISYKYLHSTMKKLRFYIAPLGMSVSGKELLTHMFEEKNATSNRLINSTANLFKKKFSQEVTSFDIYTNPFKEIRNLMSGSNYPMKDFKDFMENTFKIMKFTEVSVVSDFSCSGNYSDNLKKFLMTRSDPSYIRIFPSTKYTKDEKSLKFLTNISMANYSNIDWIDQTEGALVSMEMKDSKLERAQKMFFATRRSNEELFTNKFVDSDRVEYSKSVSKDRSVINHLWTDYKVVIVAKEFKERCNLYIFSLVDLDSDEKLDRRIFHILDKFKLDMSSNSKRVSNLTFSTWSMKYNMHYTSMEFQMKTRVVRGFKKWRMDLHMIPLMDSSLFKAADYNHTSFSIYEDDYTVDYDTLMKMRIESGMEEFYTIRQMMSDIPDLDLLDKILVKYDLLPEIKIPFSTSKDDTNRMLDVQDILKQFNEAASSSNLIGNMAKMFKVMDPGTLSDYSDNDSDIMSTNVEFHEENLEGFAMEDPELVNSEFMSTFNVNPIAAGINKMKEFYSLEVENNLDDAMTFDDEREGSRMRRAKMGNITAELIRKSVETCVDYDKKKMRKVFEGFKRNGNEVGFHNMLLLQINSVFDFQLSDSMSLYLYNHLLTKMSTMYLVKPTYKMVKFGPEKVSLLDQSVMFLSKMEEMDDKMSDILNEF